MYQSYFRLSSRPFAVAPNPEHYFPARAMERARENLVASIERASGIAVATGGVGVGKTLLCQLVAAAFVSELPVCFLSSARLCTRQTFLQACLHELGLPYKKLDEGELRLSLMEHVSGPACPQGILMIVDEADRISMELLEEIRVVTNMVRHGQPCVRLLLVGTPRLEERIGHPKLESLNQRVVTRAFLEPFSAEETAIYVQTRISAAGGNGRKLFRPDAMRAIYHATSGVPRLINQICDHALILAAVAMLDTLNAAAIEEAWSDLQQLPIPHRNSDRGRTDPSLPAPSQNDSADGIIEYGPLDDLDGDLVDDPSSRLDRIERQMAAIADDEGRPDKHERPRPTLRSLATSLPVEAGNEEVVISIRPAAFHAPAGPRADEVWDEYRDRAEEEANESQSVEIEDDGASDIWGDATELELTIAQAPNPFDEEFQHEEVVIRRFISPADLASRDKHVVSSNYSKTLAERLTAAQPTLRMHHPESEASPKEAKETGGTRADFRPLSEFLNDPRPSGYFSEPYANTPAASEQVAREPATREPVAAKPVERTARISEKPSAMPAKGLTTPITDRRIQLVPPTRPDRDELTSRGADGFDPASDPVFPEMSIASLLPASTASEPTASERVGAFEPDVAHLLASGESESVVVLPSPSAGNVPSAGWVVGDGSPDRTGGEDSLSSAPKGGNSKSTPAKPFRFGRLFSSMKQD